MLAERLSRALSSFGVLEQVVLSAVNLLASLVVLKSAGVEALGIYSFIFAVIAFAGGFLQVVLHRQMTLEASPLELTEQRAVFVATAVAQAIVLCGLAVTLGCAYYVFGRGHSSIEPMLLFSAFAYLALVNTFDLCRRYLYVRNMNAYSFRCSLIYGVSALVGYAIVLTLVPDRFVVAAVYVALSLSLLLGVLLNRELAATLASSTWRGLSFVVSTVNTYLVHARYSVLGMLATWGQNQSMTPFMMLVGGPLLVGWYNLARLFVMPLSVIAQGLLNTSLPAFRRSFTASGAQSLANSIARVAALNGLAIAAYALVVTAAHATGLLSRWIPDYPEVAPFLLFWLASLALTTLRSWVGQYFIVRLEFRFLLLLNILGVAITLAGMGLSLWIFDALAIALVGMLMAEAVVLSVLVLVARKSLHTEQGDVRGDE